MISRRDFAAAMAACSALQANHSLAQTAGAQEAAFEGLVYPPFESIGKPEVFGYKPATAAQREKAAEIVRTTPNGPTPIAIAQSFVTRYYEKDPDAISQWPAPAEWNPLVVGFFSATRSPANNDLVPWCAAFVNWCLERAGRTNSRDPASQSFLGKAFKQTKEPKIGDLVVFTCYDQATNKSVGLGHVTFVRELPTKDSVKVVGGNQSRDGHASIICESEFPLGDRIVKRTVGNKKVPFTMRLNTYVSIA